MGDSAAETVALIEGQGEDEFSFRFSGVPEDAVRVLTHQTYLDFGSTVAMLDRNGQRAVMDKLKIQRDIVRGTIQGQSTGKTQQQILDGLADGVTKVRYGNGAKVPVEAYVSMLVRTQTMNAYNAAGAEQMLAAGRMFGIFPTIPAQNREPDDPCWEWEKKKYVNLLKDPLPPASTHPHCRHKIQPVSFQQLKAERPDLYRLAIDYYHRAA